MKDKVFIDTNILIYAYSQTEIFKSEISNSLIFNNDDIYISNQVINELINNLFKKFKLTSESIENVLLEIDNNLIIKNFTFKTQLKAIKLKEKYNYSYYDSLIIATALENGCNILYSEDMQHNQIIENVLTIKNPFKD